MSTVFYSACGQDPHPEALRESQERAEWRGQALASLQATIGTSEMTKDFKFERRCSAHTSREL